MAWIFGKIGGAEMVWWAFPGAELIGLVYSILVLRWFYHKKIKDLDKPEQSIPDSQNPS